jgi:hypothetical protein
MLTMSKVALGLAVVLGTASAGVSAPRHAVHHRAAIARRAPGVGAYGYANFGIADPAATSASVIEALRRQAAGDRRCRGGNCDPTGGSGTIAN